MGPTSFTTSLPFAKTARGRIAIDERLRVLVHPEEDHGPATPAEVCTPCPSTSVRCMQGHQPQPCANAALVSISTRALTYWTHQHRATLHASAAEASCAVFGHRQVQQGTKDDHHETRYDAFEPLQGVYALGDCCANVKTPLPSLAQVDTRANIILHYVHPMALSACHTRPAWDSLALAQADPPDDDHLRCRGLGHGAVYVPL